MKSFADVVESLVRQAGSGTTVDRLQHLLAKAGRPVEKITIVRSLNELRQLGLVTIGANRKWLATVRRSPIGLGRSIRGDTAGAGPIITAIPAAGSEGDLIDGDGAVSQNGRVSCDHRLFSRLLPYYRDALRAGDAPAKLTFGLNEVGERFVLVCPDGPWWPTRDCGRHLVLRAADLGDTLRQSFTITSSHQGRLLLGYPILAVHSDGQEPFLRPVTVLPAQFRIEGPNLELAVDPASPLLNREWLKDAKFQRWSTGALAGYLFRGAPDPGLDEDEASIGQGFVDIPILAGRLSDAMATQVRTRLDPRVIDIGLPSAPRTGLYNALMVMVAPQGQYTRGAIRDYERLITQSATVTPGGTALAPLFNERPAQRSAACLVHPFALSESQQLAARLALTLPLSVVIGPPGTGKSQVIAAILVSAAAAGQSVLFASRNHKALDAVDQRLRAVSGDRVLLVRANPQDGTRGLDFRAAIDAVLARTSDPQAVQRCERQMATLADLDRRRQAAIERWAEVKARANELAGLREEQERLARAEARLDVPMPNAQKGIARWLAWLLSLLRRARTGTRTSLRGLQDYEVEIARQERALDAARAIAEDHEDDAIALGEEIARRSVALLPDLADRLAACGAEDRAQLLNLRATAALQNAGDPMAAELAAFVLRFMPVWAVTTLAAGSRMPPIAGLFDLVVFDEATQVDIASALPLLYRAKAAAVVGDPNQLAMIANPTPAEDRRLLMAHGLWLEGIGRLAQGQTNLLELISTSTSAKRIMLTEHFRCHPDIAGYVNEAFYGRQLTVLTDQARWQHQLPVGYPQGLHWTDVTGPIDRRQAPGTSGSARSVAEADAIVDHLTVLLERHRYGGTVGVVTFFDYQAAAIQERMNRRLSREVIDRSLLTASTAHRLQGDERDVILFSLCMGPDMPANAREFIRSERRLLNVAVSRARALLHVFGDRTYAGACGIDHVELLVRRLDRQSRRSGDRSAIQDGDDRFESPWEQKLYRALVDAGLSPLPQYPVAGRFLDLAMVDETRDPPLHLDIEVDGAAYHRGLDGNRLPSDLWRDHQLKSLGWVVVRFWVHELRDDMEAVVDRVRQLVRAR